MCRCGRLSSVNPPAGRDAARRAATSQTARGVPSWDSPSCEDGSEGPGGRVGTSGRGRRDVSPSVHRRSALRWDRCRRRPRATRTRALPELPTLALQGGRIARLLVVGGEDRLQLGGGLERLIVILRAPGVGVVEDGIRNERGPSRQDLLLLVRGRQRVLAAAIVRPIAAPERLIDRHDALTWNPR